MGAKLVPFGGWEMPLAYPTGTVGEHLACRERAVAFDVSHLGTVRVTGAAALERLQATFTNDLAKIGPGRAQYTHLLDADDPATGGITRRSVPGARSRPRPRRPAATHPRART